VSPPSDHTGDSEKRVSRVSNHTRSYLSPGTTTIDEMSLSDTTLGTADNHIHGATHVYVLNAARGESAGAMGLHAPTPRRLSSSIQSTPELAYAAGTSNESDGEFSPQTPICPSSEIQRPDAALIRSTSRRASNVWKRTSANRLLEEYARKSNISSSTAQTTRTSILTSGITEEPTSASGASSPTASHVSSHTDPPRKISRRIDGSSPLFGGNSVTRPLKNYGALSRTSSSSPESSDELISPPPVFNDEPPASRDSDSSWDRVARTSLGMAYKDMFGFKKDPPRSHAKPPAPRVLPPEKTPNTSTEVLARSIASSPGHGRRAMGAHAASRPAAVARTKSKMGALSPKEAGICVLVLTTSEDDAQRRRRLSRLRKQQALAEFKAGTPKPDPAWAKPPPPPLQQRQQQQQQQQQQRPPLTERPNGSRPPCRRAPLPP
jgi:hypothetical protein